MRPDSRDSRRARSITSWKVITEPRPSKTVLRSRTSGSRSTVRSVLSSRRRKSSVNQPVTALPSTVFVVRRSANSGRRATSVVPPISFSCRTTRTWSFVGTRSGSIQSAPARTA